MEEIKQNIVLLLYANLALTRKELGDELDIPRTNLYRHLEALEQTNWVTRNRPHKQEETDGASPTYWRLTEDANKFMYNHKNEYPEIVPHQERIE